MNRHMHTTQTHRCDLERPEDAPLPGSWRKLPAFHRLLITRALRPDRTTHALMNFVSSHLGTRYAHAQRRAFSEVCGDSDKSTPLLFILSHGGAAADSLTEFETWTRARSAAYTDSDDAGDGIDGGRYVVVSLGRGQERIAERELEQGMVEGTWVFLQNLHLSLG